MLPKLTNIQCEPLTELAALLETAIKKKEKLGKIPKILIFTMYLLTPYARIGTLDLSLLTCQS